MLETFLFVFRISPTFDDVMIMSELGRRMLQQQRALQTVQNTTTTPDGSLCAARARRLHFAICLALEVFPMQKCNNCMIGNMTVEVGSLNAEPWELRRAKLERSTATIEIPENRSATILKIHLWS